MRFIAAAAAVAAVTAVFACGACAQPAAPDMQMGAAAPGTGTMAAAEKTYEDGVREQLKQVDAKLASLKELKAKIREEEDRIFDRKVAAIAKDKAAVDKDLVASGSELGEALTKTKEEISARIKKMDGELDGWTAGKRERYSSLMEKELAYYKERMQKFQDTVKEKTGETKAELDRKCADLQKKQDDAQNRLTMLKAADPKAWEENESLADKAIEAVKEAYAKLTSGSEE